MIMDVVEVLDPPTHNGVSIDNPRMKEYIRNMLKLGFGNEEIVKRSGGAPEMISKLRHQYEKEKRDKEK